VLQILTLYVLVLGQAYYGQDKQSLRLCRLLLVALFIIIISMDHICTLSAPETKRTAFFLSWEREKRKSEKRNQPLHICFGYFGASLGVFRFFFFYPDLIWRYIEREKEESCEKSNKRYRDSPCIFYYLPRSQWWMATLLYTMFTCQFQLSCWWDDG
jgi:hypothetical protein